MGNWQCMEFCRKYKAPRKNGKFFYDGVVRCSACEIFIFISGTNTNNPSKRRTCSCCGAIIQTTPRNKVRL